MNVLNANFQYNVKGFPPPQPWTTIYANTPTAEKALEVCIAEGVGDPGHNPYQQPEQQRLLRQPAPAAAAPAAAAPAAAAPAAAAPAPHTAQVTVLPTR